MRLKEYDDAVKKSKTAEEFSKNTTILFIEKLTHAIMKREFLNQQGVCLFPLEKALIFSGYATVGVFYTKDFNIFLDMIFATNEQFCFLDESKINLIKKGAHEKNKA